MPDADEFKLDVLEDGIKKLDFKEFDALTALSWLTAQAKGWHAPREIEGVVRNASAGERVALIHGELSEALEEVREGRLETWYKDGKPEGLAIELADAIIRIMDMAYMYDVPLGDAMREKMLFNLGRPFRHGGKLI